MSSGTTTSWCALVSILLHSFVVVYCCVQTYVHDLGMLTQGADKLSQGLLSCETLEVPLSGDILLRPVAAAMQTLRITTTVLFGSDLDASQAVKLVDAIARAFDFFARRSATGFVIPEWCGIHASLRRLRCVEVGGQPRHVWPQIRTPGCPCAVLHSQAHGMLSGS